MKPLTNESLSYTEPCIKIFLEDIKKIVEIMGTGDNVVQISDEEFEYDSLDELTQKPKRVKKLSLRTTSQYIVLDFKKFDGAALSASSDAKAQFLMIRDILQKKKRWFSFLFSGKLCAALMVLGFASLYSIILFKSLRTYFSSSNLNLLLLLSPLLVALLLFVLQFVNRRGYFASINLEYSSNKQSFWIRNKDEILILLLVALFSWLLGKYL